MLANMPPVILILMIYANNDCTMTFIGRFIR